MARARVLNCLEMLKRIQKVSVKVSASYDYSLSTTQKLLNLVKILFNGLY